MNNFLFLLKYVGVIDARLLSNCLYASCATHFETVQIKHRIIFLRNRSVEFTFDRNERGKYKGMREREMGRKRPDTRGNRNRSAARSCIGRAVVVKTREGARDSLPTIW